MGNLNNIKEYWNNATESWFTEEQRGYIIRKILNNPKSAFHPKTWEIISGNVCGFEGMRICVPSSGDNQAVFAFALLGASVTSCDISEKQLEIASTFARRYALDIEFICDDTMHLSKVKSTEYDFVYTSNGVHVWINDLKSMYDNIGPFENEKTYAWRLQDILNAITSSKLTFKHIEEIYDDGYGTFWIKPYENINKFSKDELKQLLDWKTNPVSAIPQWITIYAEKE